MENLFLKLLNMSISAGWMALAVILLRAVFPALPKSLRCVLWGLVGVRAVVPYTFKSVLSLIPSAQTVPQEIVYAAVPQIHSGIPAVNHAVNPVLSQTMAPQVGDSANPMQIVVTVLTAVWLTGVAAMLVCALIGYLRISRRVREAVPMRDNIWLCDRVSTPFILGCRKARVYLPSCMSEKEMTCVIAHERMHLRYCDHWIKPIGFTILALHWFNPLLWMAYVLLCRDLELACDERVVRDLGASERKNYAETLLQYSLPRRFSVANPLAFGELSVRQRIKQVLNYKRPALWLTVAATVVCAVTAVCFLTDPFEKESRTPLLSLEDVKSGYSALQAAEDGCVVLDGKSPVANEKQWYDFYLSAQSGIPATVYLYQMYSDQGDDYYVKRLEYDGRTYRLSFYDRTGDTGQEFLSENEYRYLVRSIFSSFSLHSSDAAPVEQYLLADDPGVTADGYFKSLISSAWRPEYDLYNHCTPIFSAPFAADSFYGIAYGDVDGDGREEKCCLGMGPTSGLFSFSVTVTKENGKSYSDFFVTEWYDLSFVRGADGKLRIRGVTQGASPKTQYFDLSLDNGKVSVIKEGSDE
ncbi:MAG: hypothetical protein IJC25_00615 [Clostridia bacterium]|nr:hypothetical protein [Clostridia bacterium]